MKLALSILSVAMIAPLLWAMSGGGPGPGTLGHSFGVSNAIWATLALMALLVGLCSLILKVDRPEQGE